MGIAQEHRRLLGLVSGLATVAILAAGGVFAAFTATTTNPGNSLQAGSVAISDNDGANVAMYTSGVVGDLAPSDPAVVRCIKVTYTGTLDSAVKLYVSSGVTNGGAFDLTIERGTQTTGAFPNCGDFAASSTAYSGTLAGFGTDWASGVDGKAAAAAWNQNDNVAYRFTLSARDDAVVNNHTSVQSTGSHTFTWEARSN